MKYNLGCEVVYTEEKGVEAGRSPYWLEDGVCVAQPRDTSQNITRIRSQGQGFKMVAMEMRNHWKFLNESNIEVE
jgi:hypothetical protein